MEVPLQTCKNIFETGAYIFPPNYLSTAASIYISYCMHSRKHHYVLTRSDRYIYTTIEVKQLKDTIEVERTDIASTKKKISWLESFFLIIFGGAREVVCKNYVAPEPSFCFKLKKNHKTPKIWHIILSPCHTQFPVWTINRASLSLTLLSCR